MQIQKKLSDKTPETMQSFRGFSYPFVEIQLISWYNYFATQNLIRNILGMLYLSNLGKNAFSILAFPQGVPKFCVAAIGDAFFVRSFGCALFILEV